MLKTEKERVVAELVDRLKSSDTLIVADYRGLDMTEIDNVRSELLKHGARFSVVKNTLTKRAAETAGVDALNEFLDGPTAIAFVGDGDMVAVAKALQTSARETKILSLKGGILQGQVITADQVKNLASLPPTDVLQGQVLGAVVGPLNAIVGPLHGTAPRARRRGRRANPPARRGGTRARSGPRSRARARGRCRAGSRGGRRAGRTGRGARSRSRGCWGVRGGRRAGGRRACE